MVRFAATLTFINTVAIPCQHRPYQSPLCSPRMPSRSRVPAFSGSVVAFYKSLKFKTTVTPSLRRPRSRQLITDHQSIASRAAQIFGINMDGNDGIPANDPFQQESPSVTDATSMMLRDSGTGASQYSAEQEKSSESSGVSPLIGFVIFAHVGPIYLVSPWRQNHRKPALPG
jgi:hypothetical protein